MGEQLDLLGYTGAVGAEGTLGPYRPATAAASASPPDAAAEAERKAKARGHAAAGLATGLQPEELCQPWSYMVEADAARALARLEGMADAHAAELAQWHAEDGVTPTMGVLMALMRPLHGVPGPKLAKGDKRRLYGLGFQVPLRWLERYAGRHRATVCRALSLCEERGFLVRYSNVRTVARVTRAREVPLASVVTRDGVERSRVNVHGVLYLTPKGAAWLDRRGFTRAELGERNARLEGQRGQVRVGLLWAVQCALRRVAKWVARRFSEARTHATPEEEPPTKEESFVVGQAVENGPAPPEGAVSPAATGVQIAPGAPHGSARAHLGASATPTGVPARTTRTEDFYPPVLTGRAAAGGGAFSGVGGGARETGSGPPTHWGEYLDRETDRCWTRHNQVEGGPPRRVRVPVLGIGGLNYGDTREEIRPGRVWKWSPALTAAEAYPVEWGQAGEGPAGDVIRAALTHRFGELLGWRLRRRFMEWEERRRAGLVSGCPKDGCDCLAAELARESLSKNAEKRGSLAEYSPATAEVPEDVVQAQRVAAAVLSWADASRADLSEVQLVPRVDALAAVATALEQAVLAAAEDFARGALPLLEVLQAALGASQALREDAASIRWRRAQARGGAPASLLESLRDAESMGTTLSAWCRTAAAQLEHAVATQTVVPRTAEDARKAWGPQLERVAKDRRP